MPAQTQQDGVWAGANVLAVAVGAPSEDLRYLKSNSLHMWLFGYELPGGAAVSSVGGGVRGFAGCPLCACLSAPPVTILALAETPLTGLFRTYAETVMLFTNNRVHVLTSQKKGKEHGHRWSGPEGCSLHERAGDEAWCCM